MAPTFQSTKDIQIRTRINNKHFTPKFKLLRIKKFIKVELPDFNEKVDQLPKEKIKSRMKERGIMPPRPWIERPFYLSCTGGIFEPYIPPEGDGKRSIVTTTGAKQTLQFLEKKSKSMMAVRKIRNYEDDFDPVLFASTTAQDVYINAHQMMMEKNKYKIREYVTERVYPEIMHNVKYTTIHWKFLKSLEPPRVVHARCTDIVTKENLFAQVTVRFHTQQLLAIYDRFGRLMHGSEILAKDVLEYIVFEKHISNEYGVWRLHDKVIPDWLPPRQPAPKTYRIDDEPKIKSISKDDVDDKNSVKKQPLEIEVAAVKQIENKAIDGKVINV